MSIAAPENDAPTPLLAVRDVKKHFRVGNRLSRGGRQLVRSVDGVSFDLFQGETLGLVGESGCGKSTLARCLVRLHDLTDGTLHFEGHDISRLSMRALRPFRPRLQMIFQDPYTSLNPRRRVGDLIAEPLRVHTRLNATEIRAGVRELAGLVGLNADQMERFPHEFSGGQRQRIGIARALALKPRVVIADEPVSALDVSIQAQIINLFADLQERLGLTSIFIAHDLSVIRQVSTRTAVMYLGTIAEIGPTDALYQAPAHPYTEALISAVPVPEVDPAKRRQRIVLNGDPPNPVAPPEGCRFHPRCSHAQARCRTERPVLQPLADGKPSGRTSGRLAGRLVACHFPLTDRSSDV